MNDLDWAWRKARQMAEEFRHSGPSRRTKPHQLGRFRKAIVAKVFEFLAGDESPIVIRDDD